MRYKSALLLTVAELTTLTLNRLELIGLGGSIERSLKKRASLNIALSLLLACHALEPRSSKK